MTKDLDALKAYIREQELLTRRLIVRILVKTTTTISNAN